jgi:hypothetical protein
MWFKQEGFVDMVAKEWGSVSLGANAIKKWQNKICHLRQFLRGWARYQSDNIKLKKRGY